MSVSSSRQACFERPPARRFRVWEGRVAVAYNLRGDRYSVPVIGNDRGDLESWGDFPARVNLIELADAFRGDPGRWF